MMRKALFTFIFLLIYVSLKAQEAYMSEVAQDVCDCIAERKLAKPDISKSELGVCILTSVQDYKVQIARDYNVDLNNLHGEEATKLGELIGFELLHVCPETLMEIGKMTENEEIETFTATGTVQNISEGPFVIFEVKNENNRIEKFYWLTYIDTDFDLQNTYSDLMNKKVDITFFINELFDPRIKEYRMFNLIHTLEIVE